MIDAYMASPKRFDKIDFAMIGSGTGVLRYAYGAYMGEKNTALKYYEDYENYGAADKKYYKNKKEITVGSTAYVVAEDLADDRWKIENVKAYYEKYDMNNHMKALKLLTDDFTKIDFDVEYAVMYEVKIPGYNPEDLFHWDAEMSDDQLNELAFKYYNEKIDVTKLSESICEKLDDLDMPLEMNNAEDLIDDLFDAAMEFACEEDTFSCHVDDEIIKEIWYQKMRGDNYTSHSYESEFDEGIDDKFTDLLSELVKGGICLEHNMSFGDAYHQLSHALNSEYKDPEKNIEGKKLASDFLSKKMNYVGFVADSRFGDRGAQEIIIINEKVASEIKLTELFLNDADEFECYNEDRMSY